MSAAEYYHDVHSRLRKAYADLDNAIFDQRNEDAADLVRLIKTLEPECKEAYRLYIES